MRHPTGNLIKWVASLYVLKENRDYTNIVELYKQLLKILASLL